MLRNAEGEVITLTRAERRRLEKMRGKPVTYQYTLDQIEAIKRQAVEDKKEELKKEIAAEIDEHIQKEWETREELLSGPSECERMEKIMCLLLASSVKVLCEKFHWTPVDAGSDKRSKLIQFSDAVLGEINGILVNEKMDIRAYADEVYKEYGIHYQIQGDGGENENGK
ncbi:MAG: hypothetical protein SO267_15285 [Lachnospiraceae bacterium]|nr:hypothetical protein [Lachnospiraceae bacterium]